MTYNDDGRNKLHFLGKLVGSMMPGMLSMYLGNPQNCICQYTMNNLCSRIMWFTHPTGLSWSHRNSNKYGSLNHLIHDVSFLISHCTMHRVEIPRCTVTFHIQGNSARREELEIVQSQRKSVSRKDVGWLVGKEKRGKCLVTVTEREQCSARNQFHEIRLADQIDQLTVSL